MVTQKRLSAETEKRIEYIKGLLAAAVIDIREIFELFPDEFNDYMIDNCCDSCDQRIHEPDRGF